MSDNCPTRNTLLMRAADPDDQAAWQEFVEYYQRFIFILLWNMRVPEQECDDIAQNVLIRVWKNLPKFDPELAKFRTWLITIIRNTSASHMSKLTQQNKRFELTDEFSRMILGTSTDELEELYQKEWERYISNIALENIKKLFSGKAIEAFMLSLTSATPHDIAAQLDIEVQSVYNLKNRVKTRLIAEIKHLRTELEL